MRFPRQENIRRVAHDDPLPYYYRRGIRRAFRRRLELGLALLGSAPCRDLLDVGYGSGIWLPELSQRASRLVGVDVHRRGSWVREMMDKEGAQSALVTGSVLELPFQSEAFDAVVCMSVLEHLLSVDRGIAELARVLRRGAILVVGIPRTGWLMNLLIRMLGHRDIEDDHVGDARTILSSLAGALNVEETLTFPAWLSPSAALYTVCKARKP